MKIGILETGKLSESLQTEFGNYPLMFEQMVGAHIPDAVFQTFSVLNGQFPDHVTQADGWLITGSKHGAYDDLPWIDELMVFLRESMKQSVPIVGICFGHQILAQAMGGTVENSDKGWGVGVHEYHVTDTPDWMDEITGSFTSHAVHQDQVTKAPEGAMIIASSDFCPIAGLVYGDPENPKAISVQPHPEMSTEFVSGLARERLADVIPAARLATGVATLGQPVHNTEWAKTIAKFFQRARQH